MFTLRKPSYEELRDFLKEHRNVPFTYDDVEATRGDVPDGFNGDQNRVCLGHGREVYLRAKAGLREWKMFPSQFVDLIWPVPIETGRVVATLFRAPGFWTVNPCRIVYTIDETEYVGECVERFGFAYGTVGSHLAAGEERFLVEHHHDDDSVWYEVRAYSRANHWLSKLTYPYFRVQQHRFRYLSGLAMQDVARVSNRPQQVAASSAS